MSQSPAVPRLWHNSEHVHAAGSVITPGGYGRGLVERGDDATRYSGGKSHFYRENLFEFIRVTRTTAPVSRLSCVFAFESLEKAGMYAQLLNKACYEVLPADPKAPITRHHMAWMDWAGAPGRTPSEVMDAVESYWTGQEGPPTDTNAWEWLSSSGLQVIGRVA
jgi:hypothetical protein